MAFKLTYKSYGERSVLIEWPKAIDSVILKDIINLKQNLEKSNIKSLIEIKSSYNSLLLVYDVFVKSLEKEIKIIDKIYRSKNTAIKKENFLWKIPVCYDDEFGIDLEFISKEKNISKAAIVKYHFQEIYTVYFIGFLPGFLYLGGLNKKIFFPRKSTPRLQIKKGAVAIGGAQTGVYPSASPGGWNIIGNSPVNFFNINAKVPCFAKPGDCIQFYPISLKEYHDIKTLVDANVFIIESEVLDD